ncbi:MAG TPA: class I SAM-dependent methyltransferase [Patescibacteria group bacterium]|nr:class I SAM-dependent methyltransferase [Patescibacteria group bacterium]
MERGFGTNFHTIYQKDPSLYYSFSSSENFSPKLTKRLKEMLRGKVLLDVACGTCHKTNLLAKHFSKVYALDSSQFLLKYAKKIYGKNTKFNFLLSTASNIPLLNQSVDTIFISWGSFPLAKTIKELKRVLAPGGIILRIGVWGRDEFTSLFPNFDLSRVKRIQNKFKQEHFKKEKYTVKIEFKNLKIAKRVMSEVLGCEKKKINSNILEHEIILHVYHKNYDSL